VLNPVSLKKKKKIGCQCNLSFENEWIFILQLEDLCEGKEFIPGALTNLQDVQIAILVH
jgi:hypothetical protein